MPNLMRLRLNDSKRQITLIISLFGASVVLLIGLIAYIIWDERRTQMRHIQDHTRFATDLLATNTSALMHDVEEVLRGVNAALGSMDPYAIGARNDEVRILLSRVMQRNPHIRTLMVLNKDGHIAHWTRHIQPPDVSHRDYVSAHMGVGDGDLFVGSPIQSYLDNKWIIGTSISQRDGTRKLKRIIAAITDLEYFHKHFAPLDLPHSSALAILNRRGDLLMRVPRVPDQIGSSIAAATAVWDRPTENGSQIGISPIDGTERLMWYQRLEEFGLLVVASSRMSEFNRTQTMHLGLAFLFVSFIILISYVIVQRLITNHLMLHEQNQQLHQLATTDALTNLPNRFYFLEHAEHRLASARRYREPLCCLMIDIDHFKRINDDYGHDAGDQTLRVIANTINANLRDADIPCRFGGEEFAVLLPQTRSPGATHLADRIRSAVAELHITLDATTLPKMTISIGLSEISQTQPTEMEGLLKQADQALYVAKKRGRNQVVHAKELANDPSNSHQSNGGIQNPGLQIQTEATKA